jgi:predicted acetyltransferase
MESCVLRLYLDTNQCRTAPYTNYSINIQTSDIFFLQKYEDKGQGQTERQYPQEKQQKIQIQEG